MARGPTYKLEAVNRLYDRLLAGDSLTEACEKAGINPASGAAIAYGVRQKDAYLAHEISAVAERENASLEGEVWKQPITVKWIDVSNYGRVRTHKKSVLVRSGVRVPMVLNPTCDHLGYSRFVYYKSGRATSVGVHRLVCEAFYGPAPADGMQAAHGDGNPRNNTPGNLRWATPLDNVHDKFIHHTQTSGESHHASKLTDDQVADVVTEAVKAAIPQKDIAKKYGVSQALVSLLKNSKARVSQSRGFFDVRDA